MSIKEYIGKRNEKGRENIKTLKDKEIASEDKEAKEEKALKAEVKEIKELLNKVIKNTN